jgi:hypothetical protein
MKSLRMLSLGWVDFSVGQSNCPCAHLLFYKRKMPVSNFLTLWVC